MRYGRWTLRWSTSLILTILRQTAPPRSKTKINKYKNRYNIYSKYTAIRNLFVKSFLPISQLFFLYNFLSPLIIKIVKNCSHFMKDINIVKNCSHFMKYRFYVKCEFAKMIKVQFCSDIFQMNSLAMNM